MPNPNDNNEINNEDVPFKPKLTRAQVKQRQLRFLILGMIVLGVLVIAGAILYQTYLAPFQKMVLKVDDQVVKMQYFLTRCHLANDDIDTTITQLEYEEIVKIEVKKLGLSISDSEVNETLRDDAASSDNVSASALTNDAYNKWFASELKSTGLTGTQYKDTVRTSLMAVKIQNAIYSNLADTASQVHLHVIVVSSAAQAVQVKARLNNGEDFASVAKEVSIDSSTKDNGGDIGWIPQGLLTNYDSVIFSLNVGQISDPVATDSTSSTFLIFMVSEKDTARAVDSTMKQAMATSSFSAWLKDQITQHAITVDLSDTTRSWIKWQLAKK